MKLSDKELREIAANPNDEGAPVCAELLTLRREVRRLRRALVAVTWEHKGDCLCVGCAALKPQRGGK